MTVFNVGDRVRVLATSDTGSYADRVGDVAWVDRNADGAVLAHHVRLDDDPGAHATIVYLAFRPGELEPEEGGVSWENTPERARVRWQPSRSSRAGGTPSG